MVVAHIDLEFKGKIMHRNEASNESGTDYAGGDKSVLLKGYSYSLQEIHAARDAGQLLCLRMETNYNCNLDCLYCYSYLSQNGQIPQMSFKDACNVVDQGIDLGIESIVYLGGGEPFLYKNFWPFVEYASRRNLVTVIFTNGMFIDTENAKRLLDLGVSMMVKSDGTEQHQNLLSGVSTYKRIHSGLNILLETGFAELDGRYTRLGISPCATRVNIFDIPEIWRFARQNNIFPNIERATEIGRATTAITLDTDEVHWLTQKLKNIDENEFGLKWSTPFSALPAHSCGIFLAGASIKVDRGVALCPEMSAVANLSDKPLANIIQEPPFSLARNLEKNIEEPCMSCEFLRLCLGGCRSKALVHNNSIFACDPYCTLLSSGQEVSVYPTNFTDPIPQFPLEHVKKELSDELLRIPQTSPLSFISVQFESTNEPQLREVETILKAHLNENGRISRLEDKSVYLLTLPNCGSIPARKLYIRLKSLLSSLLNEDADAKLCLSSIPHNTTIPTSQQILSQLNLGDRVGE